MPQKTPRRRGRPPVIDVSDHDSRVIKKYGNRRLYDTQESRYVNQETLLDLFAMDEDLRVLDASSGEDLTERVLAQAILGEDSKREKPLMPVAVLRALARYRGRDRGALVRHLTEAVASFAASQKKGRATTRVSPKKAAPARQNAARSVKRAR